MRCAAPRALGLYLRAAGWPVVSLGDGTEMRVLRDHRLVTTRFDGWASWRIVTDYLWPVLRRDVEILERTITTWRPDVVVTTSFAAAARVAAYRRQVPVVELSIYPQHVARLPRSRAFGWELRNLVADLCGLEPGSDVVGALAWGGGSKPTLLHDPTVLGPSIPADATAVGFPYWDAGPERAGDTEQVMEWTAGSTAPTVLITIGSFLGARERSPWRSIVDAVNSLGLRAVCVGPGASSDDELFGGRKTVLGVGYVALSKILPHVDAVVHHGGIGTMFAALRAGKASLVIPQAFDQPYNARLLEATGAGFRVGPTGVASALARLVDDSSLTSRAREIAGRLIPADEATERAVARIVE